jgi:hypothetical protein
MEVLTAESHECLAAVHNAAAILEADAIAACCQPNVQAAVALVAAGRGLAFWCMASCPGDLLARDLNSLARSESAPIRPELAEAAMDLAEVNGIPFVNYVALGLRLQPLGAAPGTRIVSAAASQPVIGLGCGSCLRPRRPGDGAYAQAMLVSNNVFSGVGLAIGNRDRLDGGAIGVVTWRHGSSVMSKTDVWPGHVTTVLELTAAGPVVVEVDGVERVLHPPLRFRSLPRAVRLAPITLDGLRPRSGVRRPG